MWRQDTIPSSCAMWQWQLQHVWQVKACLCRLLYVMSALQQLAIMFMPGVLTEVCGALARTAP
jgi:hypothetical protein